MKTFKDEDFSGPDICAVRAPWCDLIAKIEG